MNSELQPIYNNIRYRLVYIEGHYYLIDIMSPIWKVFFPFVFWLFPHKGYRIDDEKVIEQIQNNIIPQKKTIHYNFLALGTSLAIAKLLGEIDDYFQLATSSVTNIVILVCSLIVFFLFSCRISHILKGNLTEKVAINQLSTDHLVIRPSSFKHSFLFFICYLFMLVGAVLTCWMFINYGNLLILICALGFVLFLSMSFAAAAKVDDTYGKLTQK
ncbi:DUF443 family protein [Salipaludibacillus agaradhaerens]|jgi:uncharacterized membrane protein (TIGR01218 family)|uniref:DUF443 domain-containing protein n=1 Tax=Salipaludibacillus agaradhaerens TaxID=76935 RepID=UPI00215129EF|nr:DUF443 domain-containing protein [Salipaludibacillus agaradhaerens]MCR6105704.1 DUF443 family protein [Salipaludibacillus agaradhaerens]MCR6117740.1 DUF443 family protein [Salipaludibacillus agaradhaerens]